MYKSPMRVLSIKDPLFIHSEYLVQPDWEAEMKRKLDRVYYPRTRDELIEGYDFMVIHGARIHHFSPRQIHDLDYAFREARMGSLSTFGPAWEQVWEVSTLYDTSPAKDYTDEWFHGVFYVRFRRDREPIFTPFIELGMEKVLGDAYHLMVEKQGAVVWGDMLPRNTPCCRPSSATARSQFRLLLDPVPRRCQSLREAHSRAVFSNAVTAAVASGSQRRSWS